MNNSEADEALAHLGKQGITVGEPKVQQGLGFIYPIDKYMFTQAEIFELKRRGKLNLEGIKEYATEVGRRLNQRKTT